MKYLRRVLFLGVLAFTFTGTTTAFAQDACPRPDGVAPNPLATPGTTAAQVEAGSGVLRDFALDARNYLRSVKVGAEQIYSGCVTRQEDGAWRSGSTYIVTLSIDGRVQFHTARAALSGRLLRPDIRAAIIAATGVRTTGTFENPDGGALPAQTGGGYAVGFRREAGPPIILVTGLDISEAQLATETVDPGQPAVRADQVVDRATLKAFVDGAIQYVVGLYRAEGRAGFNKAKVALRDPNGPWRHGPVYLFIMEPSGYTTFHGAFPDRFEFSKPTDTLRDEVTGQLILPQIIQTAASNPDSGGYVRYFFDNPDDDTDSATVPKVTYARQIVIPIRYADGSTGSYPLIFGAGIYGDPASGQSQSATQDWLARFGRTVASQAVDMIGDRLSTPSPGKAHAQVAGHTLSADTLRSWQASGNVARAEDWLGDGPAGDALSFAGSGPVSPASFTPSLHDLLFRSSFYLPVAAGGNAGASAHGRWALWGQAAWTEFDAGSGLSSEGEVKTGMLGVDYEVGNLVSGLAVSRSWGDGDFEVDAAEENDIETALTSVFPYLRYALSERTSVWGMLGYGEGSMWLDENAIDRSTKTDLEMNMGALGFRGELMTVAESGGFGLAVKSDVFIVRMESDSHENLASIDADTRRLRLAVEGSRQMELEPGSLLRSSLEVGVRYDEGDADTGAGIELGGGLRYTCPEKGLVMEANARGLLAHEQSGYEEWGVNGSIQLRPGASQRGLSLTLAPSWGVASSGVHGLWSRADAVSAASEHQADPRGRLDAEVAYGMGALGGLGLLTSYAAYELSDSNPFRVGARLNVGTSLVLSLEGLHRENPGDSDLSENALMLQSALYW